MEDSLQVVTTNWEFIKGLVVTQSVVSALIGSAFGALFAFMAAQWHFQLTKRFETWLKHLNTMVLLEKVLNEQMDVISGNRHQCKSLNRIKLVEEGRPLVYFGSFELYEDVSRLLEPLLNLQLRQDLFSLNLQLKRHNHDMTTIMEEYRIIRLSFIEVPDRREQYLRLCEELCESIELLSRAQDSLDKKLVGVLSRVGLLLKADKPGPVWRFIRKRYSYDVSNEALEAKKKELVLEIAKQVEESRKEIDRDLYTDSQ